MTDSYGRGDPEPYRYDMCTELGRRTDDRGADAALGESDAVMDWEPCAEAGEVRAGERDTRCTLPVADAHGTQTRATTSAGKDYSYLLSYLGQSAPDGGLQRLQVQAVPVRCVFALLDLRKTPTHLPQLR